MPGVNPTEPHRRPLRSHRPHRTPEGCSNGSSAAAVSLELWSPFWPIQRPISTVHCSPTPDVGPPPAVLPAFHRRLERGSLDAVGGPRAADGAGARVVERFARLSGRRRGRRYRAGFAPANDPIAAQAPLLDCCVLRPFEPAHRTSKRHGSNGAPPSRFRAVPARRHLVGASVCHGRLLGYNFAGCPVGNLPNTFLAPRHHESVEV